MTTPACERYLELDGVRGVAIVLTVVCNTVVLRGSQFDERIWSTLADAGWIGVQLFFVLSGFLITGILIDTKGNPRYFGNFYARRALRIFPIYFFVLAIIFTWCFFSPYRSIPLNPLCYILFVSNFCIAANGSWVEGYLGVTWSLAVEEHFYLFWPFLVAFLPSRWFLIVTCGLIAGSLLLRYAMTAGGFSGLSIYTLTPTRIDGLAAGALVAMLVRSQISAEVLTRAAKWAFAAGLLIMTATAVRDKSFYYDSILIQTIGYTALTLMATGLVLMLVMMRGQQDLLCRAMRWRPLTLLGFYSYAIYLYHSIVQTLLLKLPVFQREQFDAFPSWKIIAQASFTCLVLIITFGLSVISYYVIEKRFLDLRRYFDPNSTRRAPDTSIIRASVR